MAAQATGGPRVRTAALVRAAAVVVGVLVLDYVTKHTVAQSTAANEGRSVFLGIHLVHVRNRGVAFGFFSGGGAIVLVITFAALALLVIYLIRRPDRQGLWLATGLLVGGALGNLVDRLAHGAVTDFIKLPLWPAFNVADMAITAGVFVLLWVLEGPRARSG